MLSAQHHLLARLTEHVLARTPRGADPKFEEGWWDCFEDMTAAIDVLNEELESGEGLKMRRQFRGAEVSLRDLFDSIELLRQEVTDDRNGES